jgi:hypothetical protein
LSIDRLLSLYFDPNIGVLWVAPVLLLSILPMLCPLKNEEGKMEWRWAIVFLIMSIICALPTTTSTNWNSGASIVARYGYWSAVPLVMASAETMHLKFHTKQIFITFCIVIQIIILSINGGATPKRGDQELSIIAKWFLNEFSHLYNPIPQIFVQRGSRSSGMDSKNIYFWTYQGEIKKILFNYIERSVDFPRCSNGGSVKEYINSVKQMENGWVYWNTDTACKTEISDGFHILKPIPFIAASGILYPNSEIFSDGWSSDEKTHRWSEGKRSVLLFEIGEKIRGIRLQGLALRRQRVKVMVNGALEYASLLEGDSVIDIAFPDKNYHRYEIIFYWPDAGYWDHHDPRLLAFAVKKISIY